MSGTVQRLLRKHIEAQGISLAEVGRRLNRSRSWLVKILKAQRPLDHAVLEAILEVAGIAPREFWDEYFDAMNIPRPLAEVRDQNPATLLRSIVSGRELRSETLDLVTSKVYPPPGPDEFFEIDPHADEIDDLRESNPSIALAEAEHWVQMIHLRQRRRTESRDTVTLATGLGVWSSALRVRGRLHLAALALERALGLHGKATTSPTYADLLERTAFVLKSFGYLEAAVVLIQRAIGIFSWAEDGRRHAKSVLALGVVYLYLEGWPLAEESFQKVLRDPAADPVRRAAAAVNLAGIYEKHHRLEEAEEALKSYIELKDAVPPVWIFLTHGLLARLLVRRGFLEEGAQLFRGCMQLRWEGLAPDKTFLLFFDFAAVLARLGYMRELVSEARSQAMMLDQLEDTAESRQVAARFLEMVMAGHPLDVAQVEQVAADFEGALKRDRQMTKEI